MIGAAVAVGVGVLGLVGVVVWVLVSGTLEFAGEWPAVHKGMNAPPDQIVTLHIIGVVDSSTLEAIQDEVAEIAPNAGQATAAKDGRMTVVVGPVPSVDEFAKKITFGEVRWISGNVLSVVGRKLDGPPPRSEPVNRALYLLKSKNRRKWLDAASLLSTPKPDPARRDEVARALERRLAEPPDNSLDSVTRSRLVDALGTWGTADSVPLLIKEIPIEPFGYVAVTALGKLKDPRGIDPVAECLEKGKHMVQAMYVLIEFGPAAEDRVLKILDSPNRQARSFACQILKKIGTARSLPTLEKATTDKDISVKRDARNAIDEVRKR